MSGSRCETRADTFNEILEHIYCCPCTQVMFSLKIEEIVPPLMQSKQSHDVVRPVGELTKINPF